MVAKGGLLQCLGALLGSKLSCHTGEDLTKNCSPPNAHSTPIKELWDLAFSSEEIKGGFIWGQGQEYGRSSDRQSQD